MKIDKLPATTGLELHAQSYLDAHFRECDYCSLSRKDVYDSYLEWCSERNSTALSIEGFDDAMANYWLETDQMDLAVMRNGVLGVHRLYTGITFIDAVNEVDEGDAQDD